MKWRYEAFTKEGKVISGFLDVDDEKELRRELRQKGLKPKKVFAPSLGEIDLNEYLAQKGVLGGVGQKEILRFTKSLAILIKSGVPIIGSLEILYKQEKHPILKKAVKKISHDVASGKSLSEAMSYHNLFSNLYVALIKSGEVGGILDEILEKLAEYMEKQEVIKSKVKSALTYPVIVSVVGVIVIWILMTFVVPQFVEMLTSSNIDLPLPTILVIAISDFFQKYTLVLLPIIGGAIWFFKKWKASKEGKPKWDRFILKVPLFGDLIVKSTMANFSRTLSTMLSSGVSLIDSLRICIESSNNSVVQKDLERIRLAVEGGKNLSDPLKRIKYFPDLVTQMVKVGESTGKIDEMLLRVSEVFEKEVAEIVDNMTKLLEPAILVVLGGCVTLILLAIYLPMFMSAGAV